MINTVIAGNEKQYEGAGILAGSSNPSESGNPTTPGELELDLVNCTISGNRSLSFPAGGGVSAYAGDTSRTTVRMKNSIVWGNENKQGTDDDVYLYENALNNEAEVSFTTSYSHPRFAQK